MTDDFRLELQPEEGETGYELPIDEGYNDKSFFGVSDASEIELQDEIKYKHNSSVYAMLYIPCIF